MKDCYIFDIDGTLADTAHRQHFLQETPKNWDAFFAACVDDPPIEHVCEVARAIMGSGKIVIFVSGRSDQIRDDTLAFLQEYVGPGPLYMRKAGDYRADHIVKGELLDQIIADGYNPVVAFDDRNQTVKMWRARGIPCFQVAEGDF